MCLAIPAQVIDIQENFQATVDIGGVKKNVSVCLIDDIHVGDYVIIHQGYALNKLDLDEAEKTLEVFREIAERRARGEF